MTPFHASPRIARILFLASISWGVATSAVGSEIRGHSVRLTGEALDNDKQRALLQQQHDGCADINPRLGHSVQPLPAGGIPKVVHGYDIEIYYAPGQTMTVQRGVLYSIDPSNCALAHHEHHMLKLATTDGKCEVDLLKRQAYGACRSIARKPSQASPRIVSNPSMFAATGQRRDIAGHTCEIYRQSTLPDDEKCVVRTQSGFPIVPASLHLGISGVLLSLKSANMRLSAVEVRLNATIDQKRFELPSDITTRGGQGQ